PDVWITAVGLTVLALTLQSLNLAVTIARLRAPGMAWRRLPVFSFSGAVASWVMLVVGPAMLAALVMLEIDRTFEGVFFDAGEGGAPIYYQHLSWIFFTGCYLIFLLPAFGAISEILPVFSGKPLLSRGAAMSSLAAIGGIGLFAWMQNMYSASIPIGWLYMAMAAALLLAVPIGAMFVNWIATAAGGVIRMRAPMAFALAAVSTLSFGLLGELTLSVIPVGWELSDTTAATAASGYVLVGGPILGGLAALHYWFPKMTGRTMGEGLAKPSVALIVLGAQLTFIPMFLAGLEGQAVDIYKYFEPSDAINSPESLDTFNLLSTIGAFVVALGVIFSLANAYLSISRGNRAGHDPWGGETLEWFALSPPPPHNFDVVPDVRSDEPLRDIREAVRHRDASSPARAETTEPVA
ncbi:MAG TPA: cbb3-type cytochrome c oxidase subunit I, partial [Solirubrobacterales bacterium]|nr:cbb3-type cytochrome c oxidase subunit I [Solirubrobacterales bacterium]